MSRVFFPMGCPVLLAVFFLVGCTTSRHPKRDYSISVRVAETQNHPFNFYGLTAEVYGQKDFLFDSDSMKVGVEGSVLRARKTTKERYDFSVVPKFRLEPKPGKNLYMEMGTGIAWNELDDEGDHINLGGHWFFSNEIGVGYKFNRNGSFPHIAYHFRHISHADLGDENRGMNFHIIEFGFDW